MYNESYIFLVLARFDYEGENVLGAYSSLEKAESELNDYKAKVVNDRVTGNYEYTEYDRYYITKIPVDTKAVPYL